MAKGSRYTKMNVGHAMTASVLAMAASSLSPAFAQDADAGDAPRLGNVGEIVVTARKREESLLETPVVIQAFSKEKLDDLAINDTVGLAAITPGLRINIGSGGVGATAFLRGIGNGDASSFIDQSVMLNIDGVPLTHGAFYKSGLFDVAQVEVLKGPQALYFGKSASAGIISVTTADPTDELDIMLRGAYGFEFNQTRVEGVVSGPIGSGLGARVAAFYNDEAGYLRNLNPAGTTPRTPNGDEIGIRATLKFDDGGPLRARAKYMYYKSRHLGNIAGDNQYICAGDVPQLAQYAPFDDCKINNTSRGNPRPGVYDPVNNFVTVPGLTQQTPIPIQRGEAYNNADLHQASLQLDFDAADGLTITSVTGFNKVKTKEDQRVYLDTFLGPVSVPQLFNKKDFSQELRVTSDWSGAVNFIAGVFYSRSTFDYQSWLGYPSFPDIPSVGFFGPNYVYNRLKMRDQTWSVFAQADIDLAEKFDLSVGARYTRAKKKWLSLYNEDEFLNPANDIFGPDGEQIGLLNPDDLSFSEGRLTPEVTLRYHPTDAAMIYAAFKMGYKGPGYNGATTAYSQSPLFGTVNAPFKGERVIGGELGFKGMMADGQLAVTSAVYWYKYKGLQVSFVENLTFQFTTKNGADAIVKGAELGLTFTPRAVDGLSLNAFVNYNDAYYDSFPEATCWSGQTEAKGCIGGFQDLGGRTLHRSPKWSGMFGADYETAIGSGLVGAINVNANFASDTNITPEQLPMGRQGDYLTLDTTISLGSENDAWQVALIGRNLTNKIYAYSGVDGGLGEGFVVGPNGPDTISYVNRGRSIMLQLTLKPNNF